MKILLVEDNLDVRKSLKEFLSEIGHVVIEKGNGKEAIEFLHEEKVHLVLSDIQMPFMDGYELLKFIKDDGDLKDIQVVLYTGHGDLKRAVTAMKNGAYDYILKPIDINELVQIVDRVAEYLDLKNENLKLTREFQKQVKEATADLKNELQEVRKAFVQVVGTADIGIFSDSLKKVFETAGKLHQNPDIPVLIEGETGTGKELLAKYIHYGTGDIITPFIGVNCAAISSNLFESELFGYEAGAFTGGNPKGQKGKLELANDGTILLDEITEMPTEHQAKLLRVIQENEYYKVGGLKKLKTKARFICATNRDVKEQVRQGIFREDLYFRLNVGYIRIPPLRERKEEIVPLAQMFLKQLIDQKKTSLQAMSKNTEAKLTAYEWPGNVRELKNIIERIALFSDDKIMEPYHFESIIHGNPFMGNDVPRKISNDTDNWELPENGINLNKYILDIVNKALARNKNNKTKTANYLGISLRVLHTYLKKLNM